MDTLILNKDGNPLSIVPLSVVSWQTAIRLAYQGKVNVMSSYEDWIVRSPSTEMHVPSVVICSDFIKWNRQIKYNRTNVYLRDSFVCQLQMCKNPNPLPMSQLTLDHVVPRSQGGKTNWANVVTACKSCNHIKGDNHKIVPKKMPQRPNYYELVAKRMNYPLVIRDKAWLMYLSWPEDKIVFKPPRKAV